MDAKKTNPALLWGGIGGAAVLAIALFFVFKGKDKPEDVGPTPPPAPTYDAQKKIADLSRAFPANDGDGAWALAGMLDREAEAWEMKKAPADMVASLRAEAAKAREETVRLAPDHAEARAAREEIKYGGELEALMAAAWLPEFEREAIRKTHLGLLKNAAGGWIKRKEHADKVKPLLDKWGAETKRREEMMASPYGKAAQVLLDSTLADLHKLFDDTIKFQGFIEKPFVVFVEENASWNPSQAAKTCVDPMLELEQTFFDQFSKYGLTRLETPVPVFYFRSRESYADYGKRKTGQPTSAMVLAYYEWDSQRLVLHAECEYTTRIHEGAHQLFAGYAKRPAGVPLSEHFPKQSYWFHEGIAEWFGGSNRINDGGKWRYEIGQLQPD